jgi:hypothetical protein
MCIVESKVYKFVEKENERESVDLAGPSRISSNEVDSRACEKVTIWKRGKEGRNSVKGTASAVG